MSIASSLGFGGGKGTTTQESSSANALATIARGFAKETEGVRKGLIEAMQEVLKTGGSKIPIISEAVDSSRRASSRAFSETYAKLAQSDLAGTPFGEKILAEQRQTGEQNVATTQESLAQSIFNSISNFVLGQSQTATAGLGSAISGDTTTKERAKSGATSVSGSYGFGGGKK